MQIRKRGDEIKKKIFSCETTEPNFAEMILRRFLCEYPIGSYVKLNSAVGAILVEGPNRRIYFWKRTIQ
jgi:hypothetical protein